MRRTLIAAAVKQGDVVKIPLDILSSAKEGTTNFGAAIALRDIVDPHMTVTTIENSVPRTGIVLWKDASGVEIEISAAQRVEIVSLA